MQKTSPDVIIDLINEMGLTLLGDKIGLVRDEAAGTYGNSVILVAKDYEGKPMTGSVVWHGTDLDDVRAESMCLGQKVRFQRVGAVEDRLVFDCGTAVNVVIVSSRDVFYSYPDKEEE